MYIPAENVYYETILKDHSSQDLYTYATKKRVFPVSPSSLYPYLLTLTLGLKGLKIEKEAQTILNELGRLSGDLERLLKDFNLIGSHLRDAQKKIPRYRKTLRKILS